MLTRAMDALADHQLLLVPYVSARSSHTLDEVIEDNKSQIQSKTFGETWCAMACLLMRFTAWTKQWEENGSGLLATKFVIASV